MAAAGICIPCGFTWGGPLALLGADTRSRQQGVLLPPAAGPAGLSEQDDALLQEVESANFRYFWEEANPETGVVRDRCHAKVPDTSDLGSIAATGFGLTALCIGEKRGFVTRIEAQERVLNTLRFLWRKLPNHRGFFYHWANITTGERIWDSEVSSVDTAILLCGILTCREHFCTRKSRSWRWKFLTAWIGTGFRKIPRYCRMAGRRRAASCNTAGTITAK